MFVPSVLSRSSTPTVRFFSFLAISSLLVTACIMKLFVSHLSDRKGKRPAAEVKRTMLVRKSLLFTNTGICGILALVYLFANPSSSFIWPGLYIVPGGTYLCPTPAYNFHLVGYYEDGHLKLMLSSNARSNLVGAGSDYLSGFITSSEPSI